MSTGHDGSIVTIIASVVLGPVLLLGLAVYGARVMWPRFRSQAPDNDQPHIR
jgi:hypothetical protein